MNVPRELDELMWEVAERGDCSTLEQFRERYPEFDSEMEKRLAMVKTFKGSRPNKDVPAFVPREKVRSFGPSRLAVAGVAALVLGSVTFATYAAMQYVNSKRAQPSQVGSSGPQIVFNPPEFNGQPSQPQNQEPTQGLPQGANGTNLNDTTVPQINESAPAFDAFMGQVTVQSENIVLSDLISQIGSQAGLDITLAPGFEDKRLRVSFVKQPAIGVLNELGKRFGFTAFKQGKVSLLIVPATDASKPNEAGAVGSFGPTTAGARGGDSTQGSGNL